MSSTRKRQNSYRPLDVETASPERNKFENNEIAPTTGSGNGTISTPTLTSTTTTNPAPASTPTPSSSPTPPTPQQSTPQHPAGNSTTYHSSTYTSTQKLLRLTATASHLSLAHSPFFPKTLSAYLLHQQEFSRDIQSQTSVRLAHKISELEATKARPELKVKPFLGSRKKQREVFARDGEEEFGDGAKRSAVLAMESMWRVGAEGEEGRAEWPSKMEYKVFGEERVRRLGRGAGRILPAPRRGMRRLFNEKTGELEVVPCSGPRVGVKEFDEVMPRVEGGGDWVYDGMKQYGYFDPRGWSRGPWGGGGEFEEPPVGGWVFDEEFLKQAGVNVEVLEEIWK